MKTEKVNSQKKDFDKQFFQEVIFWFDAAKNKKQFTAHIKKAKKIAAKIPSLSRWPKNSEIFWDIESTRHWDMRISQKLRETIKKELEKIIKNSSRVLELGCGSSPSVKNSVCLDISFEMLKRIKTIDCFRNQPPHKNLVQFNLDSKSSLPFKNNQFDAVIMLSCFNYIKNKEYLLKEIKRILAPGGKAIIIQFSTPLDFWYRQHEKNIKKSKINQIFKKIFPNTKTYKKDKIEFTLLS